MHRDDTFHFNARPLVLGAWPMPGNISAVGAKLFAILMDAAIAASPTLADLEHVVDAARLEGWSRDCLECALSDLTKLTFGIQCEGAVHSVQMLTEAYLNDERLRFVLGDEYAAYARFVANPVFVGPAERREMAAALQFVHEVKTLMRNFALVEAARDGAQAPAEGAFGLEQVRNALRLIGSAPGGGGF